MIPAPDLSSRPLRVEVERPMTASPEALFWGWTEQFDRWIAAPGTVLSEGKVDTAFYFETHHEGGTRAPYYGRFLRLEFGELVELTWLSLGTRGLETVVTVTLTPQGDGTVLRLTHAGFPDEETRKAHEDVWPVILSELDHHLS